MREDEGGTGAGRVVVLDVTLWLVDPRPPGEEASQLPRRGVINRSTYLTYRTSPPPSPERGPRGGVPGRGRCSSGPGARG
jgi:hypothetical protein